MNSHHALAAVQPRVIESGFNNSARAPFGNNFHRMGHGFGGHIFDLRVKIFRVLAEDHDIEFFEWGGNPGQRRRLGRGRHALGLVDDLLARRGNVGGDAQAGGGLAGWRGNAGEGG